MDLTDLMDDDKLKNSKNLALYKFNKEVVNTNILERLEYAIDISNEISNELNNGKITKKQLSNYSTLLKIMSNLLKNIHMQINLTKD